MRARSRHHGAKKTWCCGQRASVASVRTCQRLAVVGRASHTATVSFARGGPSLLPLAAQWRGEGNELTPARADLLEADVDASPRAGGLRGRAERRRLLLEGGGLRAERGENKDEFHIGDAVTARRAMLNTCKWMVPAFLTLPGGKLADVEPPLRHTLNHT